MDGDQNLRAQLSEATRKLHAPHLAKVGTFYAEMLLSPDPYCTWVAPAVNEGLKLACREKPDLILSSSPPVSAHKVAHILSESLEVPWVAELRDLWSQNHAYPYSHWRQQRDAQREKDTLEGASALVTVSRGLQQQLIDLHHRGAHCIPTGYTLRPRLQGHKNPKLTILYTGSIYYPHQDPESLFAALFGFPHSEITVDFYCPPYPWLEAMITKYHLKDVVHIHPMVPHEECLLLQQKADLLLLLKWNSANAPGVLTLKLWEYLGAERPILAIGTQVNDELTELLKNVDYGFTATNERHISLILQGALSQWRATNYLSYSTQNWLISQYTSKITMEHYAKLLEEVCRVKAGV
jgi:glycosyltransferase involved in cell wall biosynthesis